MAIDAAIWRDKRRQKQDTVLAWHVALLSRMKRLPPLKDLLSPGPAKSLKGKELAKRKREHHEMISTVDLEALARKRAAAKDEP